MMSKKHQKNMMMQKKIIISFILSFVFSFTLFAQIEKDYSKYLREKILNGYNVNTFKRMNVVIKDRIKKRNEIERLLQNSEYSTFISLNLIRKLTQEKINENRLSEIVKQQLIKNRWKVAASKGEFIYIPHSDGSIVYFIDGLVSRILNERVIDEFGNVSYKNTYNMKYNDKRLLIEYEADIKDNLDKITHIHWYGAKYSPDSVFYADEHTNANKTLLEYHIKEIDHAGNTKEIHWKASEYEGKYIRKFSQKIIDSVYGTLEFVRSNITYDGSPNRVKSYHEEGTGYDGLRYTLDRKNITYNNKEQILSYDETKTVYNDDDSLREKITTKAKFSYRPSPCKFGPDVEPDPDLLLNSEITQTRETLDGSRQTSISKIHYTYDKNLKLVSAKGKQKFWGNEAEWYEYKDHEGHILTRCQDKNGNVYYTYTDPETGETKKIFDESLVITTLKKGIYHEGTADIEYEIFYGRPMPIKTDTTINYFTPEEKDLIKTENISTTYENGLVNKFRRVLTTREHRKVEYPNGGKEDRTITTSNIYDKKGNLKDVEGTGTGSIYVYDNGRWRKYDVEIKVNYDVILGRAVMKKYIEDRREVIDKNGDEIEDNKF